MPLFLEFLWGLEDEVVIPQLVKGLLYPRVTDLWVVVQRSVRNWGGRGKNPLSSSCSLGWKNGTEKKSAGWYKEKQGMTGRKEEAPTGRETLVKG